MSNMLVLLGPLLKDEVLLALHFYEQEARVNLLLAPRLADVTLWPGENAAAVYLLPKILACDSFFSRRAAAGLLTEPLLQAMAAEIQLLHDWVSAYQTPEWMYSPVGSGLAGQAPELAEFADWLHRPAAELAEALAEFHRQNGFGSLALHRVWRWEGRLLPVAQYDNICLDDLVGYQSQKDEVLAALGAGAMAVSTTAPAVWDL